MRSFCITLCALGLVATAVISPLHSRSTHASALRCTMRPGRTVTLLRVERDTTLPVSPTGVDPMSASGVRPGPRDSLLATPGTLMPAARVRLLQLDATTRAVLASSGITDAQPMAFIRAAPYRADCRTIRWTDSVPWVQPGDTGYARATLSPPERWINGVPVLVIPDVWNYPYPRHRGLAYRARPDEVLAPAAAMYSLNTTLERSGPALLGGRFPDDSVTLALALDWARSHLADAELEPVRTIIRESVLQVDWKSVARLPSRLRGTYRVTLQGDTARGEWFFRTHSAPGYSWRGGDSLVSTAALLASPHVGGYALVGLAALTADSLPAADPGGRRSRPLVWLFAEDRPTVPGNATRTTLRGSLEFRLDAAPPTLWDELEVFVPPLDPLMRDALARQGRQLARVQQQPRLRLTLRIDPTGAVRADTTHTQNGKRLRVSLVRIDTVSMKRPF
jgi:hypothetical protein